jgi:hypothetical protein
MVDACNAELIHSAANYDLTLPLVTNPFPSPLRNPVPQL